MIGINYTEFSPSEWVDRSRFESFELLIHRVCESIKKWREILKVCSWKFISDEEEQKRISILSRITTVCGMCDAFGCTDEEPSCSNCPLFTEKECYNTEPYKTIFKRVDRHNSKDLPNNEHLIQTIVDYGKELIEYLEGFKKHLLEGE